jgi:hypothetical protein
VPTPNLNIILQAVIAIMNNQVSPTVQIGTFDFGNPTLPSGATGGTAFFFEPYFQCPIAGSNVLFPISPAYLIAVQNLSPTANLQIQHTPNGSVSNTAIYGPGGVFIAFDPKESGSGFTILTLTGIGGTVPAMVLVGS